MRFFRRKPIILPLLLFLFSLFIYLTGFFTAHYFKNEEVSTKRRVPIYAVETQEKRVAITLDGVWGADLTPELLDTFSTYDLTITFFFGGYWLEEYPDVALAIHEAGHEIGNHTMTHPHLSKLEAKQIEEELLATEELIMEITGTKPCFFRPPFGDYSNSVIEVAEDLGYQTIQWSIDSLDWRDPGPDFIVRRIKDQITPGDIILMHNNAPDTPEALKILIPHLIEEGYQLVPLSELVLKENYYIEPHSGLQRPLISPKEDNND